MSLKRIKCIFGSHEDALDTQLNMKFCEECGRTHFFPTEEEKETLETKDYQKFMDSWRIKQNKIYK